MSDDHVLVRADRVFDLAWFVGAPSGTGLAGMQIQAYLTAAAINLERRAAALIALILTLACVQIAPFGAPCRA